MNEVKRRLLVNALKLLDLGIVVVSFGLATIAVPPNAGGVPFLEFLSMKVKLWNFLIFTVMLLVSHTIFSLFGVYDATRLVTRLWEAIDGAKATTLVAVSLKLSAT